MVSLLLVCFALVVFVIAAFFTPSEPWRIWGRLVAVGLACLAGADILVRAVAAGLLH